MRKFQLKGYKKNENGEKITSLQWVTKSTVRDLDK